MIQIKTLQLAASRKLTIDGGLRNEKDYASFEVDCIGHLDIMIQEGDKKYARSIKLDRGTMMTLQRWLQNEVADFLNAEDTRSERNREELL